MEYIRFAHIFHYSKKSVSEMCNKQDSGGEFLYFTKLSKGYVHSTNRAKNLCIALECRVCRELINKSATLRTIRATPLYG